MIQFLRKSKFKKELYTPEIFTSLYIKQFLSDMQFVFDISHKMLPNFIFDLRRTEKVDLVGLVLIYKWLEYTVRNGCFNTPMYKDNDCIKEAYNKYGFDKLISNYVKYRKVDPNKLRYTEKDGVFVAPIILSNRQEAENIYAPQINSYYTNKDNAFVVLQCLGEIVSNFEAHAKDDSDSILVASGNEKEFEIVCADSGIGIVGSLSNKKLGLLKPYEILQEAIKKGITSKACSDHMGYGLWLISQFVSTLKGNMEIYSQGGYLKNIKGHIRAGQFPYWKGTIIHVKLPLIKTDRCRKVIASAQSSMSTEYNIQRI